MTRWISTILMALLPALAWTQTFPTKPVRILVGSAPGGILDVAARSIGNRLSEKWGQPVLVEFRVWGISPHLVTKSPYDPRVDFAPVSQVGLLPVFLVIPVAVPANNLTDSIHQLTAELFKSLAKLDILHVPYKGGGPAATAVLTGEQRAPNFPDIPTVSESGLSGFDIFTTLGVIAPAGTPREIIAKTHADIMAALAIPEVAQRISEAGLTVIPGSGEQFGAVIRSEYEKFGQLVKMSGARRAD
jgi:tripartite-type tricarboxylate transporter receptor subunit TctC